YIFESRDQHRPALKVVYKFLHDRVQQAAYTLLTEEEKEASHLQIGQLMIASMDENELGEHLTTVVNHMNLGMPLIINPEEKINLAQMNFKVGLKAKGSTAYISAIENFKIGIQLLPENPWDVEYSLAFSLFREQAESQYLSGHKEEAEKLIETALQHASSVMEEAELYDLRSYNGVMTGQFRKSIEMGIKGLSLLQVELPDPTEENLQKEADAIKINMRGRQILDLADQPFATDPGKRLALQILTRIWPSSYMCADIPLLILSTLRMTNIALKFGDIEGYCYSLYAFYLAGLQEYQDAYDFGQVSLKMAPDRGVLNHVFGNFVGAWCMPLKDSLPYSQKAYKNCIAEGDIADAQYASFMLTLNTYFKGTPRKKLKK
ncbi:MAG: hypothetical protein JKY54_08515, partial [Flavobacteriales bacterium]|nr:hypothetical protein [Flavobacteriales bacterium]